MGPKVAELEAKMSEFSGCHALATSSGSSAVFLLFQLWKELYPIMASRTLVICPAVTWVSSITPIIHCGYEVQFCDINLVDFSFDYEKLELILEANRGRRIIIWPTALIGNVPDFAILRRLATKYVAELWCDCAENTLSNYEGASILGATEMSITSSYWAHQMNSIEGGFVFFKNENFYLHGKMLRNHGMVRSLPKNDGFRLEIQSFNPTVDPEFLFANKGTNLRPTDLNAMFGLIDFERAATNKQRRIDLYMRYYSNLRRDIYYLPPRWGRCDDYVPFCLPIFTQDGSIEKVKAKLRSLGVECRPLVGSNLLIQPCFSEYRRSTEKYGIPNAQWVHSNAAYVGIPHDLTLEKIDWLVGVLNE